MFNHKQIILLVSLLLVLFSCSIFIPNIGFESDNDILNFINTIDNDVLNFKNTFEKYILNFKRTINSDNIKHSSNVGPRAYASTNPNGFVVSTSTSIKTIQTKQVLNNKKKWVNTYSTNNNFKYPSKKFRWVTVKFSITTSKYIKVSNNPHFPKGATVLYSSDKTNATVIVVKKLSTNYQKIPNPYLSPSNSCQSNNPTIKKLAKKITNGKTDKAAADKILAYVQKKIVYQKYSNTKYGALKTLKLKRGNCVDSTHLTVALLRAAGIPAQYHDEGVYNEFGHCWPLVYVKYKGKNQWLPGESTLITGKATKYSYTAPFSKTAVNWFVIRDFKNIKPDYNENLYNYWW